MFDLFINIPPSLDFLKVRPEKKKQISWTIHISLGTTTREFFSLRLGCSNCHRRSTRAKNLRAGRHALRRTPDQEAPAVDSTGDLPILFGRRAILLFSASSFPPSHIITASRR